MLQSSAQTYFLASLWTFYWHLLWLWQCCCVVSVLDLLCKSHDDDDDDDDDDDGNAGILSLLNIKWWQFELIECVMDGYAILDEMRPKAQGLYQTKCGQKDGAIHDGLLLSSI